MSRVYDADWKETTRVRQFLEARGTRGATTIEIQAITIGGPNGTRRVRSLRAQGYPVQRAKIPGSPYWKYWLGPVPPNTQLDLFWEDDADEG